MAKWSLDKLDEGKYAKLQSKVAVQRNEIARLTQVFSAIHLLGSRAHRVEYLHEIFVFISNFNYLYASARYPLYVSVLDLTRLHF